MKTTKKFIMGLLAAVLLCVAAVGFAGCGGSSKERNKRYDVSLKFKSWVQQGEGSYYPEKAEWILAPGEEELRIELKYDGNTRDIRFYQYHYEDHPEWSGHWLSPNEEMRSCFNLDFEYFYYYSDGNYSGEHPRGITERGIYKKNGYLYTNEVRQDVHDVGGWKKRIFVVIITVV